MAAFVAAHHYAVRLPPHCLLSLGCFVGGDLVDPASRHSAATPGRLILRRSDVRVGRQVHVSYGAVLPGRSGRLPVILRGDRAALGPHVTIPAGSTPDDSILSRRLAEDGECASHAAALPLD